MVKSDYQESYFGIPQENDLVINWESHSAAEIEDLVNAANPQHQGAMTYLAGEPM